ncbi:MAG: polymorphic toxin-type HINT domain-containing protein [Pirellulales bacterium]
MKRGATGGKNHWRAPWIAAFCGLGVFLISGPAPAKKAKDYSTAERLVEEARQAQIDGDTTHCFALLRQAIRVAPDYELARWQLGQMQVGGEWLSVEEAQRRAAADPRQAEYRDRRKAHGESPEGQLALARWCRKNDLTDEARFHWASVLSVDPNNEEALRAIDMRWQNGRLLTREDIAQQKEQLRESKRATKRRSPSIAKWRRDVASSDPGKREAALDEIRAITSPDVIPGLEAVTLGRDAGRKNTSEECREICLAFLEALAKMPEPAATESLVRHAVFSPAKDVRTAAIEKLKSRPQLEYVPLLLSGLAMPIESSFYVRTDPDGSVHYTHSLYREGADKDWSMDARLSAMQYDLGSRRTVWDVPTQTLEIGPQTGAEPAALRRKAAVASSYQNRFGNAAVSTERQVWQANETAEALNARILPVLAGATGKDLGESPKAWWDWWRDQNEYYASDDKDVDRHYVSHTDSFYYGFPAHDVRYPPPPPPPPRPPGLFSCFAKGTLVWTKTGQRPIESLELGDLVLAQNVETGQLTYQPVIGRTVRPPSAMVKLSIGGEELRTTLGHPLWVAGIGWRMAKELGDGAVLHSVTGSRRIETAVPDGEEEAYNLVVAGFNTYFVGESGVLVHDNTPRRPTRATIPGLAAK